MVIVIQKQKKALNLISDDQIENIKLNLRKKVGEKINE